MTDSESAVPQPRGPLGAPEDTSLPLFVYGMLQPGEVAWRRVHAYVSDVTPAAIGGHLWIRDGLPLGELSGDGSHIRGWLLEFKPDRVPDAYRAVGDFEPAAHYRWDKTDMGRSEAGPANVVVAKGDISRGAVPLESESWRSSLDPAFSVALTAVRSVCVEDAAHPFELSPPESFDWARLYRLQMAYLLLWSIIERYCALAHLPWGKPFRRVELLGNDETFLSAVSKVVRRSDVLVDARNPDMEYRLEASAPGEAVHYYYAIRSNLAHRGKGLAKDGELVRLALLELLEVTTSVVSGFAGTVQGDYTPDE